MWTESASWNAIASSTRNSIRLLQEGNEKLKRGLLGQKAERPPKDAQLSLAILQRVLGEPEGASAEANHEDDCKQKVGEHERRKPVRNPFPDHITHVPIEILPEEVPREGLDAFEQIGVEIREVVERRPASVVVVQLRYPKFVRKRARAADTSDTHADQPELRLPEQARQSTAPAGNVNASVKSTEADGARLTENVRAATAQPDASEVEAPSSEVETERLTADNQQDTSDTTAAHAPSDTLQAQSTVTDSDPSVPIASTGTQGTGATDAQYATAPHSSGLPAEQLVTHDGQDTAVATAVKPEVAISERRSVVAEVAPSHQPAPNPTENALDLSAPAAAADVVVPRGRMLTREQRVYMASAVELPIERSIAGPGFLAQTIVYRWWDHQPLNHQQGIYAREGLHVAKSTLCEWHETLADLAHPLGEAMFKDAYGCPYLCVDATGVLVQAPERCKNGHFWVLVAPEKHVLYRFSSRHDRAAVDDLLKGYCGYLVADAHAVYAHLFKDGTVIDGRLLGAC